MVTVSCTNDAKNVGLKTTTVIIIDKKKIIFYLLSNLQEASDTFCCLAQKEKDLKSIK